MDGGTEALWCDSDEPITDPDWCGNEKRDPEARYRLITEASALRMDPEKMNLYASCHLQGLREHWLRNFPRKRPVFLSRSGGTDAGALGAVLWSGDISARWDVLASR
jgi:alpha-D-xyloside xylohydrolase